MDIISRLQRLNVCNCFSQALFKTTNSIVTTPAASQCLELFKPRADWKGWTTLPLKQDSSLLQLGVFCLLHWWKNFVDMLHVWFLCGGVYPVTYRLTTTAHHVLDLPTELLIHQSVHNWVYSGIEHDNCGLRDISYITSTEDRRKESHKVGDTSRHPTHSKYDTDRDHHKSDSLPYSQHTLMTKRTINKCWPVRLGYDIWQLSCKQSRKCKLTTQILPAAGNQKRCAPRVGTIKCIRLGSIEHPLLQLEKTPKPKTISEYRF